MGRHLPVTHHQQPKRPLRATEHRPRQQPQVMVQPQPLMAMGLLPSRAIRPQTIMTTVCHLMARNKVMNNYPYKVTL